jgi:osmotically-inducible protein OsmY
MRNSELRQDVQSALDRAPGVDARAIAVVVDNGVATLRGEVGTLFEKLNAERAAIRVYGIDAVADELVVRPDGKNLGDVDLAHALVDALTLDSLVPLHHVRVVVENGWVTLSGTLEWEYQRASAERTARRMFGVKGVSNTIVLKDPSPGEPVDRRPAG